MTTDKTQQAMQWWKGLTWEEKLGMRGGYYPNKNLLTNEEIKSIWEIEVPQDNSIKQEKKNPKYFWSNNFLMKTAKTEFASVHVLEVKCDRIALHQDDAQYMILALNNYPALKEENERLKNLINELLEKNNYNNPL